MEVGPLTAPTRPPAYLLPDSTVEAEELTMFRPLPMV